MLPQTHNLSSMFPVINVMGATSANFIVNATVLLWYYNICRILRLWLKCKYFSFSGYWKSVVKRSYKTVADNAN